MVIGEVASNAVDLTLDENNSLSLEVKSVPETVVDTAIGLTVGGISTGVKAKPLKLQSANQAVSAERAVRHAKGQGLLANEVKAITKTTRENNEVKKVANVG